MELKQDTGPHGGHRMRDTQRKRLYDAENKAFRLADGRTHNEAFSKPLPTVRDVERYVKYCLSLERVRSLLPRAVRDYGVEVKDGRGRRSACADSWAMSIPTFARTEWIVVHELTHTLLCRAKVKSASHGPEFAYTYLKLVLYCLGREAHDALKAQFKAHRVRFTERAKRAPMSPERKAALVARLAQYRAEKAQQQAA